MIFSMLSAYVQGQAGFSGNAKDVIGLDKMLSQTIINTMTVNYNARIKNTNRN